MSSGKIFEIREATSADRLDARVIHKTLFPNDAVYDYANNIGLAGSINLVAASEGRVVGFVSALVNGPKPAGKFLWERMRPYIAFIGVSPDCQNIGIGRALMIEVTRQSCLFSGGNCVYLECEVANKYGQQFFEKLGYRALTSEEIDLMFGRPPHDQSLVYCGERKVIGV